MELLQHTKPDFSNQHIFVGVDVGKKSWKTCIMTEQLEHKTFTQPPKVDSLVSYLHRTFPGANYQCVYEAGFSGFWIAEQLRSQHIDCLVVHPADVPTMHREKAFKTDRIDARKLARSLRNGDLEALYIPSREAQEDRSLVRTRHTLVTKQTRCKNQIRSLLCFYGIVFPETIAETYWSRRFVDFLNHVPMDHASGDRALKMLLLELSSLRQMVFAVTQDIRLLAQQERYRRRASCLVSIPGISTLSAMILLTELVDIRRFRTLDHLASYAGLVPGEHSSGEDIILTGISHRRNPFIRSVLIESAWVAARKDPALSLAFTTLSKRMPKNQAIVRIARKLLNRIRYVLVHEQPYQQSFVATA